MENVVFTNGFEVYIDANKPCRPKELYPGELNPESIQWRRFDRTILSWLYSMLTPDIMSQIVGHLTSHEAWTTLQMIFSTSSKAWIMQLGLEFQIAMKGGESMMEYILKMKTISNNLASVGERVKERDQILQILGGLGYEYNPIVASLTAREEDLSLHSVQSILLTHEQRLLLQNFVPTYFTLVAVNMVVTSTSYRPLSFTINKRTQKPTSYSPNSHPRPSKPFPQKPSAHPLSYQFSLPPKP